MSNQHQTDEPVLAKLEKAPGSDGQRHPPSTSRYRKRPLEIDAFRLGMDNWPEWAWNKVTTNDIVFYGPYGKITHADVQTASGKVRIIRGDWICRQVLNGEDDIWPVKPDIFAATYEMAEPRTDGHAQEIETKHDASELAELLRQMAIWAECDRAANGDGPAGGFKARVEQSARARELGLNTLKQLGEKDAQIAALREALREIADSIHERYPDTAQQAARMQAIAESALLTAPEGTSAK